MQLEPRLKCLSATLPYSKPVLSGIKRPAMTHECVPISVVSSSSHNGLPVSSKSLYSKKIPILTYGSSARACQNPCISCNYVYHFTVAPVRKTHSHLRCAVWFYLSGYALETCSCEQTAASLVTYGDINSDKLGHSITRPLLTSMKHMTYLHALHPARLGNKDKHLSCLTYY